MRITDKLRRSKAVKSEDLNQFLEETRGLERSFIREVLRSRRHAWYVAGGAGALAFFALMVLAVHIKEASQPVAPFILRVDNATGATDVVSVMRESQTSYGEVIDQYWITQYVIHHESYDYQTIQADYNATGLMSTPDVAADYHKVFEGDQGRQTTLADKARITVELASPPLIDSDTSTATARFTTVVHYHNNRPDEVRRWIATIAYKYVNAPMRPQDRLINPLGFQVTSWRIEPDFSGGAAVTDPTAVTRSQQ
jgi:type IV secretion system protein VirB8